MNLRTASRRTQIICASALLTAASIGLYSAAEPAPGETAGGWRKHRANPVITRTLGTVFDASVMKDGGRYRMWASWRREKSIALFESVDGELWSEPAVVLRPGPGAWEQDVNRISVVKYKDLYHMWYTGQTREQSFIGYATSRDGIVWKRESPDPVLVADQPWEGMAVMCPQVIRDEKAKLFRMWYSAGAQYEPDSIGYATSTDGLHWTKHKQNPVFRPNPQSDWDHHKVAGAQVIARGDWHYMFYIGFRDLHNAQIGIARSRDGITGWERHPANPVVRPGALTWDMSACYKPAVLFDESSKRWMLWYNGRRWRYEHIGLAYHPGESLGFGS